MKEAIIRMYGVTKDQNSILVNIHGVEPYLFTKLPSSINPTATTLDNIKKELNKQGKQEEASN